MFKQRNKTTTEFYGPSKPPPRINSGVNHADAQMAASGVNTTIHCGGEHQKAAGGVNTTIHCGGDCGGRVFIWVVLFCLIFSAVIFSFSLTAKKARAGEAGSTVVTAPAAAAEGVPVITQIGSSIDTVEKVKALPDVQKRNFWDNLWKNMKVSGAIAYRNALAYFLKNLARDAGSWLAAGAPGGEAMWEKRGWGLYLEDLADGAVGTMVEDFAQTMGGQIERDYRWNEALEEYTLQEGQCYAGAANGELNEEQMSSYKDCMDACKSSRESCANSCMANVGLDIYRAGEEGNFNENELKDCLTNQQKQRDSVQTEIKNQEAVKMKDAEGQLAADPGRWGLELAQSLCNPSIGASMIIQMGMLDQSGVPSGPECTLRELYQNWDEYVHQDTEEFLRNFMPIFNPWENDLGIALSWHLAAVSMPSAVERLASVNQGITKGWKGVEGGINSATKGALGGLFGGSITPPTTVEELSKELSSGSPLKTVGVFGEYTGEVIADSITTFLTTIISEGLKNLITGTMPDQEETGPGGYRLGDRDPGASYTRDSDLKDKFAKFAPMDFPGDGFFELLARMTTRAGDPRCSGNTVPGVDQCVIDEDFRMAIEQEMTVREALEGDNPLLHGERYLGFAAGAEPSVLEGYPYRSLVILRKYRVLPVGWELAASYIKNYSEGKNYTLREVYDNFDNPESPFYRLVDPDWVLKASEQYCRRSGYGEEMIAEKEVSGGEITLQRNSDYCADTQSCLKEGEGGNCELWGYCMEERPFWNFQGDQCLEQYNTCQSFTNKEGAVLSYLKNSLDHESCDPSVAGCQWYCQEYNTESGVWACTAPEEIWTDCGAEGGCSANVSCIVAQGATSCQTAKEQTLRLSAPCSLADGCETTESCTIPEDGIQCAVEGCSESGDLMANGGFEKGNGEDADNWVEAVGTHKLSSERPRTGQFSLKSYSLYGEEYTTVSSPLSVEEGSTYLVKGWVYNNLSSTSPGGQVKIEIVSSGEVLDCVDEAGAKVAANISQKTKQWEELLCRFAAVGSEVMVNLVVYNDPVGIVYFDDLEMKEACQLEDLVLNMADTEEENTTEKKLDAEMYFDDEVEICEAENEGCGQFISLKSSGVNLLLNGSFEYFEGVPDDGQGDILKSWRTADADSLGQIATSEKFAGDHGLLLTQDMQAAVETGLAIAGRTFTFSLYAKGCTADDKFSLSEGEQISLESGDSWSNFSTTYDFPETKAGTVFSVFIDIDQASVECYVDALKVQEGGSAGLYSEYGETGLTYLRKSPDYYNCQVGSEAEECDNYALSCEPEDVGCELYTPLNGEPAVPGQVEINNYCPAECAGYDIYKQEATNFKPTENDVYLIPAYGQSCSLMEAGCEQFTNIEEAAEGGEAIENYSYLRRCVKPEEEEADCAVYYSWLGSDASGYQLATYNLQRSESSAAPRTIDELDAEAVVDCEENFNRFFGQDGYDPEITPDCRQFYDSAGGIHYRRYSRTILCTDECVQYRQAEPACSPTSANCSACGTTGGAWQSAEGGLTYECVYQGVPSLSTACQEPGCRVYVGNNDYNIYYLLSDDFEDGTAADWLHSENSAEATHSGGHSLSFTGETAKKLNAVCDFGPDVDDPDSDDYDLCEREEGCACLDNDAGADEDGDQDVTEDAVLEEQADCWIAEGESECIYRQLARQGGLYLLSLWAKGSGSLTISFTGAAANKNFALNQALSEEWQVYQFGPVEITGEPAEEVTLDIDVGNGSAAFIDNILFREANDAFYLIEDSWNIPTSCNNPINDPYGKNCQGSELNPQSCSGPEAPAGQNLPIMPYMLGCQTYTDRAGNAHHLRDFSRLCQAEAVGCEAFIDTFNSATPYEAIYHYDDPSVTIVPEDEVAYLVNDPNKSCTAENKGCRKFGQPELDENEEVAGYADVYLLDDPDKYEEITCQQKEVGCAAFTSDQGEAYFKDPGSRVCEYKQLNAADGYGWYKKSTASGPPDCPSAVDPVRLTIGKTGGVYQPAGECLGGAPPRPNLCFSDDDCPGAGGHCFLWAGLCPDSDSGCTEYLDPASRSSSNLLFNGSFEQQVANCDGWEAEGTVCDKDQHQNGYAFGGTLSQTISLAGEHLYIISAQSFAPGANVTISECGELNLLDASLKEISEDTLVLTSPNGGMNDFSGRFYMKGADECTITIDTEGGQVDEVSLRPIAVDYLISESAEKESCTVYDPAQGCVLFNERSYDFAENASEGGHQPLLYDVDLTEKGGAPVYCPADDDTCQADSNILLKVKPDRECAKWFYCKTSSDLVKQSEVEQTENICFELGLCDRADENADCKGFPITEKSNLTFEPATVERLKNLSGYVKAGFDWSVATGEADAVIEGFYPLNEMSQVGSSIGVVNGSFELTVEEGQPVAWSEDNQTVWRPEVLSIVKGPTQGQGEADFAPEGKAYLKVAGKAKAVSNFNLVLTSGEEYTLGLKVNTNFANQPVKLEILNVSDDDKPISARNFEPRRGWREEVMNFVMPDGADAVKIRIGLEGADEGEGHFYIDDLKMKSGLGFRASGPGHEDYLTQSCRLYPEEDSLSCEYQDDDGYQYQGWYGYCLERDPRYPDYCLTWWPTDSAKGGTGLSEQLSYYKGRAPLYYCLEEQLLKTSPGILLTGVAWEDHPSDAAARSDCLNKLRKQCWNQEGGVQTTGERSRACRMDGSPYPFRWSNYDLEGPWSVGSTQCYGGLGERKYETAQCHLYCQTGQEKENIEFSDYNTMQYDEVFFPLCKTVAQVVTAQGENKAWTSRLSQQSDYVNDLGYTYGTDYPPFGSILPPQETLNSPESWSREPDDVYYCPGYILRRDLDNYGAICTTPGDSQECEDKGIKEACVSGGINCECQSPAKFWATYYGLAEAGSERDYFVPLTMDAPDLSIEAPHQARAGSPYSITRGEFNKNTLQDDDILMGLTKENYEGGYYRHWPERLDSNVANAVGRTLQAAKGSLMNLFAQSYGVWQWSGSVCRGGDRDGNACDPERDDQDNNNEDCAAYTDGVCYTGVCEGSTISCNPSYNDSADNDNDGNVSENPSCGAWVPDDSIVGVECKPVGTCECSDDQLKQGCLPKTCVVNEECDYGGVAGSGVCDNSDTTTTVGRCDEQFGRCVCAGEDCGDNEAGDGECSDGTTGCCDVVSDCNTGFECVPDYPMSNGLACDYDSTLDPAELNKQCQKKVVFGACIDQAGDGICRETDNPEINGQSCTTDLGCENLSGSAGTCEEIDTSRYLPRSGLDWTPDDIDPCTDGERIGGDLCALPPKVENFKVNDHQGGEISVKNSSFVEIKFNTDVDAEQLPLASYAVDWGDGNVSGISNASLQDKPYEDDPYKMYHYYSYWELKQKDGADDGDSLYPTLECDEENCTIIPMIQIMDNWGYCNGNESRQNTGFYAPYCLNDSLKSSWDGESDLPWRVFNGRVKVAK